MMDCHSVRRCKSEVRKIIARLMIMIIIGAFLLLLPRLVLAPDELSKEDYTGCVL